MQMDRFETVSLQRLISRRKVLAGVLPHLVGEALLDHANAWAVAVHRWQGAKDRARAASTV